MKINCKYSGPADLREHRDSLVAKGKKLLDENTGPKWTKAVEDQVDALYNEISACERELERMASERDADFHGHDTRGDVVQDANTGRTFQVIRKGSNLRASIRAALPTDNAGERGTLRDFLAAVAGLKAPASIKAALSEGTDSAGGYTLPAFLQQQFLEALVPVSSLLTAGAGIVMLTDGAKSYRFPGINAIPTAAWRAEGGNVATSDPTFRNVDVTPRSLSFQFKVSRELLADSVGIDAALARVIAQSMAKELDRAGLRGSGTPPEPRGILNTSGIQTVTNGANGATTATIAYANHISATQAILAADAPMPTASIMAPRSMTTLAGLLDTTNQPRQAPPLVAAMQFVATSQIPVNLTVGTSNDCTEIYVGDFRNFLFAMRESLTIMRADQLYAGTGEIGFIGHVRADVACLYPAAFAVCTGVRA